jgi:hypothetical protein
MHILRKFRMPPKPIVHNGTSFTAQLPFSFYLIQMFQVKMDHEYFNRWKETPIAQIFYELGVGCTHLLFEAYIRYSIFLFSISLTVPGMSCRPSPPRAI